MNPGADQVPASAQAAAREPWWRRRIVGPIVEQLRQGITPRRIAFTLAAGSVIGIFPILGATTLLCALLAFVLRLNQPVIQLVNYLIYPLQIALLFPFYRAGEVLFGADPVPLLSIGELNARFWTAPGQFLIDYGMVALYGVAVWSLVAIPATAVLFFLLDLPLKALARRTQTGAGAG